MSFLRPDTRAHAHYEPCSNTIDVRLFDYKGPGWRRFVGKPVVFEEHEQDGSFMPPTISLKEDAAQSLMDALWDCGVRPTQGHGSAGQLAATERHLEDLRAIVFQQNDLTAPGSKK